MTGLAGLDATSLASPALNQVSDDISQGGGAHGVQQLAFTEITPEQTSFITGSVTPADTLREHFLSGLGKINSSFTHLDSLAPEMLPDGKQLSLSSSSKSSPYASETPLSSLTSATEKAPVGDHSKIFEKVEQEGIAMYNEALSRQMAFSSAEFETHIITVSSQNMTSTLKSLLTQGG